MKRARGKPSREGDLPFLQVPVHVSADDEDKDDDAKMDGCLVSSTRALLGLATTERLRLFPVQRATWREWHRANNGEAHDLCVASPTGSGKTLAYLLPVFQALLQASVRRLRALIVVPTRDLATQVHSVAEKIAQHPEMGGRVRVGLASGQTSVTNEENALLPDPLQPYEFILDQNFNNGEISGPSTSAYDADLVQMMISPDSVRLSGVKAGYSAVDMLIATPGRLITHINNGTITMGHLRYLIIDEVDRLLRQNYQNWLDKVFQGVYEHSHVVRSDELHLDVGSHRVLLPFASKLSRVPHPERGVPHPSPRLIKIALSATITRDPSKLAKLNLHSPKYIEAATIPDHQTHRDDGEEEAAEFESQLSSEPESSQRYVLPKKLRHLKLNCALEEKPLFAVALLCQLALSESAKWRCICFTSSLDNTFRLKLFLRGLKDSTIEHDNRLYTVGSLLRATEYSSRQVPKDRSRALAGFRNGEFNVLIASDAATRGIDVPQVHHVVNYNPPVFAKTYVHRAGRTARAAAEGCVVTLLTRKEGFHFKAMLEKTGSRRQLKKYVLEEQTLESLRERYSDALAFVKAELRQPSRNQTRES